MGNISEMNKDQKDMWNRLKEPAPIIDKYGNQRWFNRAGELHRENDLPAVIWKDGANVWYKNGKLHRENELPACIYNDGTKFWYKNGKLHRENDLPAVISSSTGRTEWYLNGEYIRNE